MKVMITQSADEGRVEDGDQLGGTAASTGPR